MLHAIAPTHSSVDKRTLGVRVERCAGGRQHTGELLLCHCRPCAGVVVHAGWLMAEQRRRAGGGRRCQDLREVYERLLFTECLPALPPAGHRPADLFRFSPPLRMSRHDRVVLVGDLNFRVQLPSRQARELVAAGQWDVLWRSDELCAHPPSRQTSPCSRCTAAHTASHRWSAWLSLRPQLTVSVSDSTCGTC
jgi:hypothetical protein